MTTDLPKLRLCHLIEKVRGDGTRYLIGQMGRATVLVDQAGETAGGQPRWGLSFCDSYAAKRPTGRAARAKAEGVEFLGGMD